MRRQWIVLTVILLAVLGLAACGSDDPDKEITTGAELLRVTFDAPDDWETGRFPADTDDPAAELVIDEGRYQVNYRADRSASLTWGAGGEAYEDVVIEVDIEQLGGTDDNLYGVVCRFVENDDGSASGYALLISGDGHYGIADLSRRSLDFILEWHQSDAIKQGQAQNTLRAVCVDDYLAVYANGEFLGDVRSDDYQRAGQVALVIGTTGNQTVSVAFDNLTVYEGTFGD